MVASVLQASALTDLGLFLASFFLYGSTLIPSVLSADNGEFQLVAWKLGIAHPPGYPLYTLVGFLFSRFFASPAFALNLLSVILASTTLVLVSRAVRAATGSTISGLAAAVILGTSTTFWAQATTANIRMPTALFTAWCVYALVSHQRAIEQAHSVTLSHRDPSQSPHHPVTLSPRHLFTFALAFSLGLGHHPSLIFPGIFFIIYLLLVDPSLIRQPRRWSKPAIILLLGLLVFLYLPIRGATGGTLADGESTTNLIQLDKFLDHVLARGFEGDFFYFVNTRPDLLGDRMALLPTLFNFQFNTGALILGAIGVVVLARRNGRLLVLLLGGIIVHTSISLTYRAPQTVEYLMPAYVLFAIMVGMSIGPIKTTEAQRTLRISFSVRSVSLWFNALLAILALGSGLARGLDNLPSYRWLAQHEDTRRYAESLLQGTPPNTIILSNWHWAGPMWYLQQVEGVRPDVSVVYVYPRGEPLATSWLNSIRDSLATGRPVVVDMFFRDEFAAAPYVFEPISREAFQVRASPRTDLPDGFTPLDTDFGSTFRLVGYRLLDAPARTTPTEPLILFLAWRVEAQPNRDYSFFVHLVDSTGRVMGQSDRAVPAARYEPGAVIVERFFVAPRPDVAPGTYSLVSGIYSIENNQIAQLGDRVLVSQVIAEPPIQLTPQGGAQAANHPISHPAIALTHGIRFLGSTASTSGDLQPASRLVLDLHFLATRPLTRDFVVSVQMIGAGYSWKVTSDSVPALGAIPTLKWIAGSDILDRHVIDIPADAPPGPATVALVVYDNFTQQPLALLDEQLIQQGQSILLGTWNIITP